MAAMHYLTQLSQPKTAEELQSFITLITQIEKNGIEIIWGFIKDSIAERMFAEFKSVYPNPLSSEFTEFISAGSYTLLSNLDSMLEQANLFLRTTQEKESADRQPYNGTFFSAAAGDSSGNTRDNRPPQDDDDDYPVSLAKRPKQCD